ncbi:MAG: type 2 isopentenyl-diphosphate Delta-isomerase [Chloroflexi bacterium]|nr:type 2 isopentenyl-diphosphate Delta-isomerase [Chloroflexota bacterium]
MSKVTPTSARKADHIQINLEKDVRSGLTTGLERYHFIHQTLPEFDLDSVDLKLSLFGRRLQAPMLISSMTGGTEQAKAINRVLAMTAQETGIAMGLGSQRAAIEDQALIPSFKVRDVAPDILLFANLGAVQLNYGYGIEQCQRAVDMIEADALILHLNPLQEAVQPEGDTHFAGLLRRIEAVCKALTVPVIAKEVGWGISKQAVRQLYNVGIAAIDVAGAGGTSWTQVEMHRAENESQARLAAAFLDWGIPTATSIQNVKSNAPELPIIASGGIRTGVDIAKSIALGASLGGLAAPFLKSADIGLEKTIQISQEIQREIQVAMFAAGAVNISALQQTDLVHSL